MNVAGGSENTYGKVNILLQTYISHGRVDNFSLVSDQAYVAQVPMATMLAKLVETFQNKLFVVVLLCSTTQVDEIAHDMFLLIWGRGLRPFPRTVPGDSAHFCPTLFRRLFLLIWPML